MKGKTRIALIFMVGLIMFGCTSQDGRTPRGLLPKSIAAPGEIFVSMDSLQWKGAVGQKIREIMLAEIEGLPRDERMFTLRYIQPQNMSSSLRQVSNIIYVTTFDINRREARIIQNYFPKESQEKIMSNPSYFLTTSKDVYARDQEIMYLFGQTEASLLSNLDENSTRIVDHFNRVERARLESELFAVKAGGVQKAITERFGVSLTIPQGFELAQIEDRFAWIVFQDPKVDKHIHISWTDYYDQAQFESENIIMRRNELGKKYIYEDKAADPESFMVTEEDVPYIPVKSRQTNLGGKYAIESRGLWKTNTLTMGGPFIGLTTVDESTNRLYYIEGFLYSPGENQREFLRELESIIYSFKTSE